MACLLFLFLIECNLLCRLLRIVDVSTNAIKSYLKQLFEERYEVKRELSVTRVVCSLNRHTRTRQCINATWLDRRPWTRDDWTLNWTMHVGLFVLFCAWGFFFEWFFGFFWSIFDSSPWIYPDSIFRYSSWKVAPMWGLGALTVLQLSKAVRNRDRQALIYVAIIQAITILWIIILSILAWN